MSSDLLVKPAQTSSLNELCASLLQRYPMQGSSIYLRCGDFVAEIESNSANVLAELADYFKPWLVAAQASDTVVYNIDSEPVALPFSLTDWPRESGKTGTKEAYCDLSEGRIIRKTRTAMVFVQATHYKIAIGSCRHQVNQLVNFINNQYMNRLQQQQWLINHASAFVYDAHAYAVAGFSGSGKSTLMLRMLDDERICYLTNDRLFLRRDEQRLTAAGIAKLPRVNPGTLLHNPRLTTLLTETRKKQLMNLPDRELWALEEKYDVNIATTYGSDKIVEQAPLAAIIILNWQLDSGQPCRITSVDLSKRLDLLDALRKSPGPFFQNAQGCFLTQAEIPSPKRYLNTLGDCKIFEVSGRIDFATVTQQFYAEIAQESGA